jgi:hypothetical protein
VARSFNIAGPCIPGEHYMLPPEWRLGRVQRLIEQRKYFTLHAGRQTGKTTSLMWFERHLNASGRWRAVWVDLETAREQPDPAAAFPAILETIDRALRMQHTDLGRPDAEEIEAVLRKPTTALLDYLARLTALDERPLVLLLDEADGLVGPAMIVVVQPADRAARADEARSGDRPVQPDRCHSVLGGLHVDYRRAA